MKTFKMSLENIQGKLSRTELRKVMAGSGGPGGGGGTYMTCACSNGANPPFSSSWTKLYTSAPEMISDISRNCQGGVGGCSPTKFY